MFILQKLLRVSEHVHAGTIWNPFARLTQEVFESEQSYTITYYDNPLQPGIAPRWSRFTEFDVEVKCGRRGETPCFAPGGVDWSMS